MVGLAALIGLGAAFLLALAVRYRTHALPDTSTDTEAPPPAPLPDRLSDADITKLARNAGFTGTDLRTAVAVALAESGGKVTAYNPETAANTPTGLGSYGLWQIYRQAHPEFATWQLYDPAQNAMAAYRVYVAAGYKFTPWTTYKTQRYTAYVQRAQNALNV